MEQPTFTINHALRFWRAAVRDLGHSAGDEAGCLLSFIVGEAERDPAAAVRFEEFCRAWRANMSARDKALDQHEGA
jgi:hypothetical protein